MNLLERNGKPWPVLNYDTIDSTNAEARRLVTVGRTDGFVVSAGCQTMGRGRFSRVWQSPPGNVALTISVARPDNRHDIALLSLVTGLAISDTLQPLVAGQAPVNIKWPNDVLIDGAKISGTLIEIDDGRLYVGIGLNLLSEPEGVLYPTTSLRRYCEVSRSELVNQLVTTWRQRFDMWQSLGFSSLAPDYSKHLWRHGELVTIAHDADRMVRTEGRCLGVNEHGHLLLEVSGIGTQTFVVGDVAAPIKHVDAD